MKQILACSVAILALVAMVAVAVPATATVDADIGASSVIMVGATAPDTVGTNNVDAVTPATVAHDATMDPLAETRVLSPLALTAGLRNESEVRASLACTKPDAGLEQGKLKNRTAQKTRTEAVPQSRGDSFVVSNTGNHSVRLLV